MKSRYKFRLGIAAVLTILAINSAAAEDLVIERLTWSGIKMVSGNTTVFIDAVGKDLWDGEAPEGLVPVTADTRLRYALITHAHNDHFDVDTLKEILGPRGYVICHEDEATYIASRGLQVLPARMYEPIFRGGFIFTAVPAEDGFGDHQVSWVISKDEHKVLHAGDTLWHGQWGNIGRQYGPFDVVFMPINGARVARDPMPETPAVQTPLQAVDAAQLLRADLMVPIHYGLNNPPNYVEVDDPLGTAKDIAAARGQGFRHLLPGASLTLGN